MENEVNEARPALGHPALLLIVAGIVGLLADALLYGQGVGVGWALFLLLLPGALLFLGAAEGRKPRWGQLLPVLGTYGFFAAMQAVHADPALAALNFAACVALLGLLARLYLGGTLLDLGFGQILGGAFRLLGAATWSAAPVWVRALACVRTSETGKKSGLGVARGLVLALPVLLVLVPLLASADPRFGQLLEHLLGSLLPKNLEEVVGRTVLTLFAIWLIGGGLAWTLSRAPDVPRSLREAENHPLGFLEGVTVLGVVALVFGTFLGLQASYLFGGDARVQSVPGLTYSDYARRGFTELVLVATLTAALVEGLRAVVKREGVVQTRVFSGLATAGVGMTLVLLASAWQRMAAYEAAYGATATRIWVDAFIVWLGLVLLWLAATLWRSPLSHRFALGGLACAMGFGVTVNLLRPERLAATHNLTRPRALENIAVSSENADIALLAWRKLPPGQSKTDLANKLSGQLDGDITMRWPSWNFARGVSRASLLSSERELRARVAEARRRVEQEQAAESERLAREAERRTKLAKAKR